MKVVTLPVILNNYNGIIQLLKIICKIKKKYKVTKTAEISNFIFKFENELKYAIA